MYEPLKENNLIRNVLFLCDFILDYPTFRKGIF